MGKGGPVGCGGPSPAASADHAGVGETVVRRSGRGNTCSYPSGHAQPSGGPLRYGGVRFMFGSGMTPHDREEAGRWASNVARSDPDSRNMGPYNLEGISGPEARRGDQQELPRRSRDTGT